MADEPETTPSPVSTSRGRGRPSKTKGICRTPDCGQPEMCTNLCRRCYHQTYNTRKKSNPPAPRESHDLSAPRDKSSSKRQRRRSASKGPFTTAEGQVIDTPYVVEIAKDARSKCQVCKERIHREELRIGVLRAAVASCRWYHPQCLEPGPEFSTRRLHGRKKLDHADRAALKHLLASPKKHKHRHRDGSTVTSSSSSSSSSSRSHSRKSGEIAHRNYKSRNDKHRPLSVKDKRHRLPSTAGHKKESHPPPPISSYDSSESSSYSDADDYDEEEGEESYSDDSSQRSSGSDDDAYFRRQ